jgi:L-asparaginase
MSSPLPRLRVLATGGTIAGAQTGGRGRGYRAAAFSAESLIAAVPQLATLAALEVEPVAAIGSQDMDDATWLTLAARTQAATDDSALAGVVITHGTDTMEETAYFLHLVVRTSKPVVLVGAMRPATAISADGPMNLYNAIAVAADPAAGGRGVLVVANDEIHFAREITKTNTTQVGTFRSGPRGLAGLVNHGRLHLHAPPLHRHTAASEFAPVASGPLPRVDIVYAHAGMGRGLIDAAVQAGAAGLVIAGVGDGNLGAAALAAATAPSARAWRSCAAPAPAAVWSSATSRPTTTRPASSPPANSTRRRPASSCCSASPAPAIPRRCRRCSTRIENAATAPPVPRRATGRLAAGVGDPGPASARPATPGDVPPPARPIFGSGVSHDAHDSRWPRDTRAWQDTARGRLVTFSPAGTGAAKGAAPTTMKKSFHLLPLASAFVVPGALA